MPGSHAGRTKGSPIKRGLCILLGCCFFLQFTKAAQTAPKTNSVVNINAASERELITLPEIDRVRAREIISHRPYRDVNELSKAKLPDSVVTKIRPLVTTGNELTDKRPPAVTPAPGARASTPAPPARTKPSEVRSDHRVNLNTADAATLEALPGVGPVIAKEIVTARPFRNVDDLEKVSGIGPAKFAQLKDLVTVESATVRQAPARQKGEPRSAPAIGQAKVNINTATREELEALPGIGPVKAQAIIAARPFDQVDDITRVKGIKEGTLRKIRDYVTVR